MRVKQLSIILTLLLALLIVASAHAQSREDKEIQKGLSRMTEMIRILEKYHYSEIDTNILLDNSIRGMLSQLDPHSSYLSPEQTQQLAREQHGEYSGIGLTVGNREGQLTVVSPVEDGPAAKKGIRTGDVITHINNEATSEGRYVDNVNKLRGKSGTTISVTIEREGVGSFDVEIVREKIALKTVPYSFMINDDIGYIRLNSFSQTSDKEVADAVATLKRQGMQNLIFDLRSNPGGDLDASVGVANQFISDGLIVYTKGLTDASRLDYYSDKEKTSFDGPMIVLINNGSASGSEVVAGALQDHDRAWLIGEKSWGKGLVQSQFPLFYGASLSLTTAKYYTPSGRLIQRQYTPGSFDNYFNPQAELSQNLMEEAMTTHLNRVVYGGNGIMPDTVLKAQELSDLTQQIMLQGKIFNFSTKFVGKNNISKQFKADASTLDEFKKYLVEEGMKIKKEEWDRDSDYIKARITMEVVSRIAGSEEAYRSIIDQDEQLQEALKRFQNAKDLLNKSLQAKGE